MDPKTATAALDYVLSIANRRQLRTVSKVAVKHLVSHLGPDDLAEAITEISGSLIERTEADEAMSYAI